MVCSGRRVSTLGVVEPIFDYFHSMGSRKQDNHFKNFIFLFRTVSPSPQSLRIVFFHL